MLVHFIGGPVHGHSEAIHNPPPIYRLPELKRLALFDSFDWSALHIGPNIEEHEYRITRRTPRYVVAEWVVPTIQVQFTVELEVHPFDREESDALSKFIYERRMDKDGDVKCVAADADSSEKLSLTLVALVEGPEDPIAIQLAAEKVQHYLDANVPPSIQHIQHTAATTA